MHHTALYKNQRGAISLITVIFITILLTVLTTSFIRLTVNEQREAVDDDLTTRAFYAAESGIQDALRAINDELEPATHHFNDCTPAHGPNAGEISDELDTEYTCQIIDMTPPDYRAYLDKNDSTFFKLKASSDITEFTVYWHKFGDDSNTDGTDYNLRGASTDLLNESTWNADDGVHKHPAMLRLQVVSIPATGDVERDDFVNKISFLDPTDPGGLAHMNAVNFDGKVSNADCTKAPPIGSIDYGEYVCKMTVQIVDNDTEDYFLRIKSIYTDTHIKVVANDGTVNLIDAQAVVDVTGRVADVYRRVEQRVNLENDLLWPEFALYSAQDICKDFSVTHPDAAPAATFAIINGVTTGSCTN